jgi:GT2 family glycosyltransferase
MNIAILMACHNRIETTRKCLYSLFNQDFNQHKFHVFLVDDGSIDGTFDMVKSQFPAVTALHGNGSLFWNGAMRLAWTEALKFDFDYYLWLNDDVQLMPDALKRLLAVTTECQDFDIGAVVGSMQEPSSEDISYGGRNQKYFYNPLSFGKLLDISEHLQYCRFINGNLCLIPRQSVQRIGILDPCFTHNIGDHDYGLRLIDAGFKLCVAPGVYGYCSSNPKKIEIFDATLPIEHRLSLLSKPNAIANWREQLVFDWRHGGAFKLVLITRTLFRDIFPKVWLWIKEK